MLTFLGMGQSKGAAVGPGSGVAPGTATLGGTITTCSEASLVAGGETITITLTGELTWSTDLGADNAVTTAFIQSFDSAQSEATGWNNIVRDTLTYAAVTRTSATVATVILPAYSGYAITAPETITATMAATTIDGRGDALVASPVITVTNVSESIALTGTATASIVPDDIVTGGKTLIFTVTGDQFVATLGADNAITTAFLAGIDSAQSEAQGWDATVKAVLTYTMLTRDSATQCTLVLPAAATYAVGATETITATVPATALLASAGALVASPVFTITPVACNLTGTLTTADQDGILAGGETIILTLTGGVTWGVTVGADNAATTALIAGLDSAQSEAAGWDAIVKAALTYTAVTRTSDTVVTITLPAYSGYAITANETITVTVPGSALSQVAGIVATPTATIDNVTEAVALSGTAMASVNAGDIVAGGKEIVFNITGDQFVATLGANNGITTAFLAAIDSDLSEATGWDAVVKANLDYTMLTRDSGTQCTLILPAAATYAITAAETITASPPATSLLASSGALTASPTMGVGLGTYSQTLYVATALGGGSDANPGTLGSPKLTLGGARDAITTDCIVYVRAGTYTPEGGGTGDTVRVLDLSSGKSFPSINAAAGERVTFKNYPGESPILDGENSIYDVVYVGHDGVQIDGFECKNCEGVGIYVNYASYVEVVRNYVHDVVGSGGHNVAGIKVGGATSGTTEVEVYNNTVNNIVANAPDYRNNYGILIDWGGNIKIHDNLVLNDGTANRQGIKQKNGETYGTLEVYNNAVFGSGSNCCEVSGENTLWHHNLFVGGTMTLDSSNDTPDHNSFRYNTLVTAKTYAVTQTQHANSTVGSTFQYNIIYQTGAAGAFGTGMIAVFNYENETAYQAYADQYVAWENNMYYNPGQSMRVSWWPSASSGGVYTGLAAWQAAADGYDQSSFEEDPDFTDNDGTVDGDYHAEAANASGLGVYGTGSTFDLSTVGSGHTV